MTFKKLLIILTVMVTVLTMMLLGTSYAWYTFDNAVTSFDNVQTMSENIDLAVVFANTDNIATATGVPLTTSEVAANSSKTLFTMSPSSKVIGTREVAYEIKLVNLSIDPALTSITDLNYSLLKDGTQVASGNFKGVTGDTLVLKPMTTLQAADLDKTHSFEFRLWLAETGKEQNNLMGKKITGTIKVSTAIR